MFFFVRRFIYRNSTTSIHLSIYAYGRYTWAIALPQGNALWMVSKTGHYERKFYPNIFLLVVATLARFVYDVFFN
jgi:hypothetical protein